MGRGKIEIKRIENSSNRQVTYSKRRNGIIKKAKEISVLCDAKVSLVIIGSSGKMHDYCSPSTPLVDLLDDYHKQSGKRLWDAKHENLSNEIDRIKKENDNLQIELRHLKGEDISSMNDAKELMLLEEALENGLSSIRERKMDFWKMAKKNEKIMEEENKHLNLILHQQEMAMGTSRDVDDGYEQRVIRDYNSQMPFAFRVQPIQPNLQERM
ncbi:hypothetical protein I3843_15G026500 [Carya illinoinensis]|uniref:Uncharacterized protein n=1 Tax=Carya illinoinensis TaxID=32201 RepID=A0A8T1N3W4_CARIL|nr:agamous-like MADS-box protein MADS9 [Carya illinoinensis]KAG2665903.1 hypothetical protein I3760_15G029700 [Carya illinoinensis]KAG6626196.1 hypothetical protein CIPAW_15G031300 [Carya illinoinensis]KAG6674195.1 hypothetical protein I3842_15G030100 [Carya illinoinensis]KAG7943192.1 hypothetical protein I3843_15G026500 [Carya illinoinensis]